MRFIPEILCRILSFMEFVHYDTLDLYPHLCIQSYYKRYPMSQLRLQVEKYTAFNCRTINDVFSCYKCLVCHPYLNIAATSAQSTQVHLRSKITNGVRDATLFLTQLIILCFDTIFHDCVNVITGCTLYQEPFIVMYGVNNRVNFVFIMLQDLPDTDWSYCFNYIPKKTRQLGRVQYLLRHTVCRE